MEETGGKGREGDRRGKVQKRRGGRHIGGEGWGGEGAEVEEETTKGQLVCLGRKRKEERKGRKLYR
jgi:hypothetical protein